MNAKRKGSRNERRTMAYLKADGYSCTRAAASLGVFDVIGVGETDVVLVQVKSNRWPGATETERIRLFRAPATARKFIYRWVDRRPAPDIREVK